MKVTVFLLQPTVTVAGRALALRSHRVHMTKFGLGSSVDRRDRRVPWTVVTVVSVMHPRFQLAIRDF